MELVSEAAALGRYVWAAIQRAQGRLGVLRTDMTSYGHDVALTRFPGLIASIVEAIARHLGRKRSRSRMIRAAREVHRLVDPLVAKGMKQSACRAGCFFCCFQPVEASLPEVLLIAEELGRSVPAAEMAALRVRIGRHKEAVRANPEGNALCPLNVDGRCQVYDARPLACRGYNAVDAQACATRHSEGSDTPIQYVGDPVAVTRAADLALQLATRYHYPEERVSGLPLVPALAYALDHPEEWREPAFLRGVCDEARRPGTHAKRSSNTSAAMAIASPATS
jgi:Fe-S-cluster containining protein